jgi:hypothetical protein
MLDYGEILRYLAKNPPQMDAERQLHASLLELLAKCLRMNERVIEIERRVPPERRLPPPQPTVREDDWRQTPGEWRQDNNWRHDPRRMPQERRIPLYPQQRRLPMS